MSPFPDREADISCGELLIWILQRQFPDSADYWDGNWLHIVAHCSDRGASVTVSGCILHLGEIKDWMEEMEMMDRTLTGTAKLPTTEPNLSVTLACNDFGQVTTICQITADQLMQSHEFTFDMDQSYLKGLVAQCRKILSVYEIRDPEQNVERTGRSERQRQPRVSRISTDQKTPGFGGVRGLSSFPDSKSVNQTRIPEFFGLPWCEDFRDHRCPHDAWLESVPIFEIRMTPQRRKRYE